MVRTPRSRTPSRGGRPSRTRGEIVNAFASEGRVAMQITWSGTHDGDLEAPDGSLIPASGRRVMVEACMIQRVRDGKIVEGDHYFDLMTLLAQVGAVPAG